MSLLLPFTQARGHRTPRRGPITWLVLHTTESDIPHLTDGTDPGAERTASYFQTNSSTSSHWVVDDDSAVQCVAAGDEAYTQAPWNPYALAVEQEGRAAFTEADWLGPHAGILDQTAKIAAAAYTSFAIPLRYLDRATLTAALADNPDPRSWPKGVTTHVELNNVARNLGLAWVKANTPSIPSSYTQAQFFDLTSHTDPGTNFPMNEVLARARRILDPEPPIQPTPDPITFPEGDDSMLMIHVPVADDGRECYARFAGDIAKSPTGGLAIRDLVWIDGPTNAGLKRLGFEERRLPVGDLHGVALLGPLPEGDPVHDWKTSDFMRVIGS